MKLAILSLPKIERDKLMQTLLANKAKGDVGFIRACGLDPEVFDRQFLTVCISRDLRSTNVSLHENEMEMLWSMNQLDALIESGSREPFLVRKAGTFDGDLDAARETGAKVMDEARREAGYRGETREDLKKWLIETGRLPANCNDLMEPLIERQETPGRKENTGAILVPDADELRTVLGEVSEALKDDDAVGIVVSIGPIDYFIAKNDSGLPGKVVVAVGEGSQVLGALYVKRNLDGMSGRLQPFQKHENDESAKKRLQGVLDKMLTDCAQTESERRPVRLEKFEKELRDQATRIENDREAKEAALNQPHHLLFFSAVDPDGVTRFFDILNQGDGFSLGETAVSAPRLGGCTETVYKSPSGGTHHVHRLYGKFRTDSAHRAMHDFAKHTGLAQVAEIAETLNLREAQPTWELIFEKLGCSTVATGPASQEEQTKLKDERPDYRVAAPSAEDAALRAITGDTKQAPTDEVPWD